MRFELGGKRVWVAGERGMVGSALGRRLERENCEIITLPRSRVDLRDQERVKSWVQATRPNVIFLAAAKVGGILANDRSPGDFLYDNLMIEANVINAALAAEVEKLVFLGSSCIYPKYASQPIDEDVLLTGSLEPTNQWYALAKILGVKLCQAYRRQHGVDFISAMPTNLYGPGDNFDLETSHVIPALMRKAHESKVSGASTVTIWGSGAPRREFLHVDDCADAVVHLAKFYSDEGPINVGCGKDIAISDLARIIADVVGFEGEVALDPSKPDGTPRKVLNTRKLNDLGWFPSIELREGLASVYDWYKKTGQSAPARRALA